MRVFVWIVSAVAAIVVALGVAQYVTLGWVIPRRIVERLDAPIAVESVTREGLVLADGRTLAIPHVADLPADAAAVREAVRHGVEVGADGRMTGLMKIWHWCGNDPVRYHLARVDLTDLALLFGAPPTSDVPATVREMVDRMKGDLATTSHGLSSRAPLTMVARAWSEAAPTAGAASVAAGR